MLAVATATVSILVTQVVTDAISRSALAIGGPPPTAGIGSIEPSSQTVQAGCSATFNLTVFTNYPWLVGNMSFNLVNSPRGVTATFVPKALTNFMSEEDEYSLSMIVTVAEDAPQGNVTLTVHSVATMYPSGQRQPDIFDGICPVTLFITAPSTRTTTSAITTPTTTTTTTLTTEVTRTQIVTSTSAVTQTSTSTTTISTTLTSTSTERVADPSTYAWAIGATVAAVVLAGVVVLLLRRTRQ